MNSIIKALKERGYDTVPEEFYSKIAEWRQWYRGNVAQFHNYKVYNGDKKISCRRYSLGMGKMVSEDWANLLMNEKVQVTLEGKKEQEFFNQVCRENNFAVKINEMQEIKAALGTAAYIPRAVGVPVDLDTGRVEGQAYGLKLDYVSAEHIYPLSWENGMVIECAFAVEKTVKGEKYVYLQIHRKENGTYAIDNLLYLTKDEQLKEVPLSDVPGFENLPATVHTTSTRPLFVLDRLNIVNNLDESLPLGVPCFANAIDCLKGVDVAYDSYVNEFVLGKKRIIVKPEATKTIDGDPLFDPNELVFYLLPEDGQNGNPVTSIDMTLRTQEHNAGIQDMLNALSVKCGFGENHYKFEKGTVTTATQIISENGQEFRTLKKHEIVLENVLKDLCRILLWMGNTYLRAGLNEDVEISIDFDDSIIEDDETNFNRDSRMVSMGAMNLWEFRAKWMNEDEATAKASLPSMEELSDNGQDEVE